MVLELAFSNRSPAPLSGWAIQLNKNAVGLASGPMQWSTSPAVSEEPYPLLDQTRPGPPVALARKHAVGETVAAETPVQALLRRISR